MIICTISACFISCGSSTSKYQDRLQGKWIWKEYESNPIYMYLEFTGETVKYGTNLYGSDLDSATWVCKYTVDNGNLIVTTDDGTNFTFSIVDDGTNLRIYNENHNEFVKS